MTALTASQLLGSHAGPRPAAVSLAGALRALGRRLGAPARRPRARLADLPRHLLRDVGLDGVDLRALDL